MHTHTHYFSYSIIPHLPSFLPSITEKKFHERRGSSSDLTSALSSKQKEEIENDVVVFLSLYTSNIGYLYLLDERTGVPMIKNSCDGPSTYPIIISNAYATVDKLLPLMQMGMTLMRGEVALKVLGQVICLGANTIPPRSWVGASQDIAKLMYSGQREMHLSDEEKENLMILRDKLAEYASAMSMKVQKEGLGFEDGSEWVVEMSFFRTVLEKFDSRRSYAGLKPIKDHGRVIWTRQVESCDQAGDVKSPGDYVEARYRYDAFIHTAINVHQEQGSEVSSMTSVYFEDSSETSQSQPDDAENIIPTVIIQTLSAVCEEDMDAKDQSSAEDESREDKAAATTAKSEGDRVSPTSSNTLNDQDPQEVTKTTPEVDQYVEITASNAEHVEGEEASEKLHDEATTAEADVTGECDEDEYTEITASSGESSSSHALYTAVLEALGFAMDENNQMDDAAATGQSIDKENATLSSTSPTPDVKAQTMPTEETKCTPLVESTPGCETDEDEDSPTAEGEFSNICALETIKFILTGGAHSDESKAERVNTGIVGLSVLGEDENPIESDELGTTEELFAFVSDSIQKKREIKEKDTQIKDMQRAITTYDSMKEAEINEKEAAIREFTRTLRLYEEEFHSITSARPKSDNDSSVEISMAIRSSYNDKDAMLGTDIASKIRSGMKAHLYDLHHTHLSKDFEIEQLRLAFHMRETEIIREKNLEIASLHKKLAKKEIQMDEYERRITKLLGSNTEEDDFTISTGSISKV